VPTGLAVGLALKESRYAGFRRFAPSATVALTGSPFPGRCIGRGFGWVIFGRAAYINRKINVTVGVMTPGVAMISGARGGLNGMAIPPPTLAFSISGPLRRADLEAIYERVSRLLEGSAGRIVVCDLDGAVADAVTVEALARLGLAARRHGCRVTLRGASAELRELLEFSGLWRVLGG